MKRVLVSAALLSLLAGCAHPFDYLKGSRNSVQAVHDARYTVEVDRSFRRLGEFRHQPVYDGTQFNVTLVAFARGGELILVHAEKHTDGSGGLDYSSLPAATFSGLPMNRRESCVTPEEQPDPYSNPELAFIRDKGSEVRLPMHFSQYFLTSEKGTSEIVLTYGQRVPGCSTSIITPEFTERTRQTAQSLIRISRNSRGL